MIQITEYMKNAREQDEQRGISDLGYCQATSEWLLLTVACECPVTDAEDFFVEGTYIRVRFYVTARSVGLPRGDAVHLLFLLRHVHTVHVSIYNTRHENCLGFRPSQEMTNPDMR